MPPSLLPCLTGKNTDVDAPLLEDCLSMPVTHFKVPFTAVLTPIFNPPDSKRDLQSTRDYKTVLLDSITRLAECPMSSQRH